jgi:hypothetical protein
MLIVKSLHRAENLIHMVKADDEAANSELFRAVVVLTHAYLEDFLRALGSALLPVADEKALNEVPLVGLCRTGRAEKFFLGKLVKHRGKSVDDLIRESVSEYLGRSFNNMTEIFSFLNTLGLRTTEEDCGMLRESFSLPEQGEIFAMLNAMMQRRHHIVHRADQDQTGEGLKPINGDEVFRWLKATAYFMSHVINANFPQKQHREELQNLIKEGSDVSEAVMTTAALGDDHL